MKKILFLAVAVLAMTIGNNLYAQLKVQNDGKVVVYNDMRVSPATTDDTIPVVRVTANAQLKKTGIGVYSQALYKYHHTNESPQNKVIAIYGNTAWDSTQSFNYAPRIPFTAGVAGTSSSGIGVYGGTGTGSTLPALLPGAYAGYFCGNVYTTGTTTASTYLTSASLQNAENMAYIQYGTRAENPILKLRPITFQDKQETVKATDAKGTQTYEQKQHYGLIAQDVIKVIPEVVCMNQDSTYSINYNELIPLLIMSVQEMSAEITALKDELSKLQATEDDDK